jgi:solute carrier family 25 protein 39/40
MDRHVPPSAPDDLPSDPADITAVQKMLSATSGSLLTGLLGMASLRSYPWIANI